MTSTEVRTYAVGDVIPQDERVPTHQWCEETVRGGYYCSLRKGHGGPQHVAAYSNGTVVAVADRDASSDEVEGTWKPGDVVYRPTHPQITVATVLHVGEDDGVTRAWMVGRMQGDDQWRLLKSEVETLRPYDGDSADGSAAAPTIADFGAAFVHKEAALNGVVRRANEARDEARARRDEVSEQHEAFRRQVVETAMRYARRHDWCSVVRDALRDMGLTVTTKYRVHLNSVTISNSEWTATRDDVAVVIESESPEQAWRDVDALGQSDAEQLIGDAGVVIPEGWEFVSLDSSTHGIEEADD